MKEACPQKWSNDAAKKNRMARPHRQHCSIEQSDQQANCRMNNRCCNQSIPVKGRDVGSRCISPVSYTGASKQVNRIPDTVLSEIAVEKSREDHHDSACDSATKAGGHGIAFDRKERSVN